jgi:hypothetical protein
MRLFDEGGGPGSSAAFHCELADCQIARPVRVPGARPDVRLSQSVARCAYRAVAKGGDTIEACIIRKQDDAVIQ